MHIRYILHVAYMKQGWMLLEMHTAIILRITFPILQQNASPLAILAGYLEVLGKKIDCTEDQLDCELIKSSTQTKTRATIPNVNSTLPDRTDVKPEVLS